VGLAKNFVEVFLMEETLSISVPLASKWSKGRDSWVLCFPNFLRWMDALGFIIIMSCSMAICSFLVIFFCSLGAS